MEYPNLNGQQALTSAPQDPRLLSATYKNMVVNSAFNYDLSMPPLTMDLKSDDELYIENWLSSIGKIRLNLDKTTPLVEPKSKVKPSPIKHMLINASKEKLKKSLEISACLEETQQLLKENVATMTNEEWRKHTMEMGALKDELTLLLTQFNPNVLKSLKYDISQRAKKRRTQKRKRVENKLQQAKQKLINLNQHKKIDLWLVDQRDKIERSKAEELMMKDADCVLAGVTKKKSEAKKQLSLVAALIKLRTVRELAATSCGEKVPDEDNAAFSKTTETLVKYWETSAKTYAKEEQGLKLMLEQSVDQDTRKTEANKEKQVIQQWDYILFGPRYVPAPLYWALTSAQRDMEKFIAIRKSWDTFLTNDKSRGLKIPIGWVVPESNPSLEWSQYKQN